MHAPAEAGGGVVGVVTLTVDLVAEHLSALRHEHMTRLKEVLNDAVAGGATAEEVIAAVRERAPEAANLIADIREREGAWSEKLAWIFRVVTLAVGLYPIIHHEDAKLSPAQIQQIIHVIEHDQELRPDLPPPQSGPSVARHPSELT
jgi:hypothetical protein